MVRGFRIFLPLPFTRRPVSSNLSSRKCASPSALGAFTCSAVVGEGGGGGYGEKPVVGERRENRRSIADEEN